MRRHRELPLGKHRNRLVLLFLSLMIVFSIVSSALFSYRYARDIGEVNLNSIKVSVDSVMESIDHSLLQADNLALLVGLDKNVTKALSTLSDVPAGDFEYMNLTHQLMEVLKRYVNAHSYISNVIPITLNGTFLNEMLVYESAKMTEMIQMDRLRSGQESIVFLGNIRPLYYTPSDRVYTCVRKIYHVSRERNVAGYIQVDIQPDDIDNILVNAMIPETEAVFLCDDRGSIIQSYGDAGLISLPESSEKNFSEIVRRGKTRYLLVGSRSDYSGWSVVVLLDYSKLFGNANVAVAYVGISFALGIILSIILAVRIMKTTHIPLNQITHQMNEIEHGNFDARVKISTGDEFEYIGDGLNRMAGQLKQQLDRVMQEQAMKKDAEMYALQAQINPHFLYNTLAAIRFLTRKGEREKTEKVTVALTELCAAGMDNQNVLIPLEKELNIAGKYFDILQVRYGEIIEMEVDVPEEFMNCVIPKFTLQPIIENAVFHGILLHDRGVIRIHAEREGDNTLVITVSDDGVGMDSEKVEMLNQRFEGVYANAARRVGTFNHIGMENVSNRIKMEFGSEYGMHVTSELGRQTIITITIPIRMKKETG